jgi:hypothetical protein
MDASPAAELVEAKAAVEAEGGHDVGEARDAALGVTSESAQASRRRPTCQRTATESGT